MRYLEVDPGRSLLVLWRLRVGGRQAEVVLSRGLPAPGPQARRDLDRAAAPHVPARLAVDQIGDPPVLVAWFPADPGLPLLAGDIASVAGELAPQSDGGAARLLAWMPRRRAALRLGEVVVKLYADPAEAEAAAAAHAACAQWLPTPETLGVDPLRGVTAQRVVAGRPLGRSDAAAVAERAGRVIRELHEARIGDLVARTHLDLLDLCSAAAHRTAVAEPALATRLARALERLEGTMPPPLPAVPSHGDYTVGQMIEDGERLWVVDTDTLCAAPAAHDLAAYAANLVSGRRGDGADAAEVLRRIVAGYGTTPPGLEWHMAAAVMRRIDRPLRRLKKRWPDRTDEILSLAEELLPG